ncbi:MAG: hypothetical protein WCI80_01310 [Bacteroidota bacterium]
MTQALNLANFANNLNTSGAISNAGLQNNSIGITAGTGISVSNATPALGASTTIANTGVTSFNGSTGSITGVNSIVAGTGITVSGATGNVTINATNITSGTAVSVSGTAVGFTSIPSTAKRISFIFNGVGTNGSSVIMIQIGSGSYATSGYAAMGGSNATTTYNSTGFTTSYDSFSTNRKYGIATLDLITSNTWVFAFQGANINTSNATTLHTGAGSIALSGALDRIQVTTINGTDSFNVGTVNIFYE